MTKLQTMLWGAILLRTKPQHWLYRTGTVITLYVWGVFSVLAIIHDSIYNKLQ